MIGFRGLPRDWEDILKEKLIENTESFEAQTIDVLHHANIDKLEGASNTETYDDFRMWCYCLHKSFFHHVRFCH